MNLFTLDRQERKKFRRNKERIAARMPYDLDEASRNLLIRELEMGLFRDIQAQRLPPNVRIPSRKRLFDYIKTMYNHTGNLRTSLISFLSPGTWTSSGGSFRLGESAGYDIVHLMSKARATKGKAVLLEVGAGYAGFHSDPPQGVHKLYNEFRDEMGERIFAHFTNLTKWHGELPRGVVEHPGYTARDIGHLEKDAGLNGVDIVYSQCAAYFEPLMRQFIESASRLINAQGMLVFNAPKKKKKKNY